MLVVIMLVSMITATHLTAAAKNYSGKCGENLTWSYDAATATMTIDGSGDMYNYLYSTENKNIIADISQKDDNISVHTVIIGDSVTRIGEFAFYDFTDLENVIIGSSVTVIDRFAFSNCTSLKDVVIPDSVTSIADSAFSGCSSITSVTIPDSVTNIGDNAFDSCASLTGVTFPDSVTSIGRNAFISCTSLCDIILPDSVIKTGYDVFLDTGYWNNGLNWLDNLLYVGPHLIDSQDEMEGSYEVKDGTKYISDYALIGTSADMVLTIPESVISIGEDALDVFGSVTVKCYKNTCAHSYAKDNRIDFELIDQTDFTSDTKEAVDKVEISESSAESTEVTSDPVAETVHNNNSIVLIIAVAVAIVAAAVAVFVILKKKKSQ